MFSEIGNLLIQTFFNLFLVAVLLRFLLQIARADFYNPVSQFLVKVTNPVLKPLRRVIPGVWGIDFASLALALIVEMLTITAILLVYGVSPPNIGVLLIWSVLGCIAMVINIYYLAILASIILSWVAMGSYNPTIVLVNQLAEPVLRPFRKLLPAIGGLDLSPILVFLAINVIQIVLRHFAALVGVPGRLILGL
jgi:YggT family protein